MAEVGGALEVAGGMLYDAAGAGRDWLLGADEVFWRAILAKASKMDEPFGAGLFCAWFWSEAANPAGGLPGGVVDSVFTLEKLVQIGILVQPGREHHVSRGGL